MNFETTVYSKGHFKDKEYVTVGDYQKYFRITPDIAIIIIEKIEKHIASQHQHTQTEINFDYCNCDNRDMPTYIEDNKTWCPQCGYEVL